MRCTWSSSAANRAAETAGWAAAPVTGNLHREDHLNTVVIGTGYVGIPRAVLLADVPGLRAAGVQRCSGRSGALNTPVLADRRDVIDLEHCADAGLRPMQWK
jgi:hypothetical protein